MNEGGSNHYILFIVAGTTYAIPSHDVAHVEMIDQVTAVPNAAAFVDGVVFSRGQVVPAINMRARFGFPRTDVDVRTRLLVVTSAGRSVGLLVDACREFLTIPASSIHPPGDALTNSAAQYLGGIATIGNRMIVILQLDELLNAAGPLMVSPDRTIGEVHGNAQTQRAQQ
jgi:purine-binding chemotaxis protein CheW